MLLHPCPIPRILHVLYVLSMIYAIYLYLNDVKPRGSNYSSKYLVATSPIDLTSDIVELELIVVLAQIILVKTRLCFFM